MANMKTKFIINGTNISVVRLSDETALDKLPPKIYSLQFSDFTGFYLTVIKDQLQLPETIYGIAHDRVKKIITTYQERAGATGILMTGDKGTGKTLTLSLLANTVVTQLDMPVIMIREAYNGEQFDQFIQAIGESCIVFDEFGKMYGAAQNEDKPQQDRLLSLMDGTDKTKRLIILTENDEMHISDFMLNRPSRIYYHFRYRKLDESSIGGYCGDHGVSATAIRDIVDLSRRSKIFSFDMLQTIVEEHLRYKTPIEETIEELNIDVRQQLLVEIEIVKIISKKDNLEVPLAKGQSKIVEKPLGSYSYTYIRINGDSRIVQHMAVEGSSDKSKDDDDDDADSFHISDKDVAYESAGKIVYETNQYQVIAKDIPMQTPHYFDLF